MATTKTTRRQQTLYREVYTKPGLRIRDHCKPSLPSAAEGFVVDEAFVTAAGRVQESDGRVREYQELRIYLKEQG